MFLHFAAIYRRYLRQPHVNLSLICVSVSSWNWKNIISLKETGVLISYLYPKRREPDEWKSTVKIDIWIAVTSWTSHSKWRYEAVSRSSTTNNREMKGEYPDNPDIWSFPPFYLIYLCLSLSIHKGKTIWLSPLTLASLKSPLNVPLQIKSRNTATVTPREILCLLWELIFIGKVMLYI